MCCCARLAARTHSFNPHLFPHLCGAFFQHMTLRVQETGSHLLSYAFIAAAAPCRCSLPQVIPTQPKAGALHACITLCICLRYRLDSCCIYTTAAQGFVRLVQNPNSLIILICGMPRAASCRVTNMRSESLSLLRRGQRAKKSGCNTIRGVIKGE